VGHGPALQLQSCEQIAARNRFFCSIQEIIVMVAKQHCSVSIGFTVDTNIEMVMIASIKQVILLSPSKNVYTGSLLLPKFCDLQSGT
jgi:hypothetical protein